MENTGTPVVVKKRPTLLSIICVISWIIWILGALIAILMVVKPGLLSSSLSNLGLNPNRNTELTLGTGLGYMLTSGTGYFILVIILAIIACYGVCKMWKLKKSGYWLFSISVLLLYILPPLLYSIGCLRPLSPDETISFFNWGLVIILVAFILFGINWKHLS